jgi:hypothetical protein
VCLQPCLCCQQTTAHVSIVSHKKKKKAKGQKIRGQSRRPKKITPQSAKPAPKGCPEELGFIKQPKSGYCVSHLTLSVEAVASGSARPLPLSGKMSGPMFDLGMLVSQGA